MLLFNFNKSIYDYNSLCVKTQQYSPKLYWNIRRIEEMRSGAHEKNVT